MIKPYIMFNRNCGEAFKFYQGAFEGEMLAIQKYGDMPPSPDFPVAEDDKELVLHSELKLTESGTIMGSDSNRKLHDSEKVFISIEIRTEEAAIKAWNILKEDGSIFMELAPTFFSKLHGSLMDKYGVSWMFTVN